MGTSYSQDARPDRHFLAAQSARGGSLAAYRRLVAGEKGWWYLAKYEVLTGLLAGLPGALGLVLRKTFYPSLFRQVGRGAVFGRNLTLRHPHKISLGDGAVIDENCCLDAKGGPDSGISIGAGVFIGRGSVLSCKGGRIEIGDRTSLGLFCLIHSENLVRIGADGLIASFCYLVGGGAHRFDRSDIPINQQGVGAGEIRLGDDCWLGAGVQVLNGVTIGRGAVIGAGSLVNRDLPDWSVAVGSPARAVKHRRPSSS